MKSRVLFSCLTVFFFSIALHAQWQTMNWHSGMKLNCERTDSIQTIRGLKTYAAFNVLDSTTCIDAELRPDNETIRLTSLPSTLGDFLLFELYGLLPTIGSQPISPPWGAGEFGLLSVRLVSSSPEVFLDSSAEQGVISLSNVVESSGQQFLRNRYRTVVGQNSNQTCLQYYVEGGEPLYTTGLTFYLKEGATVPSELDLRLEYSFEQVDAKVYTEYYAPPSSFNGQAYVKEFDEFYTTLQPDEIGYEFNVGLEENTSEPQDIIFKKEGGVIALWVQEPNVQTSTVTQEPHRISFDLQDVEFCLDGEMVVPEGSSIRSKGTKYSFRDSSSCLGILQESSFTFASGSHDDFTDDGVGMLLLYGSSKVHFEENAELSFGGVIALRETEEQIPEIVLERGARLGISETASVYSRRRASQRYAIKVLVNEGATFDMSAANPEVQDLFEVENAYPSHGLIERGSYAVFPNPVNGAVAKVRRGANSLSVSLIEVIDAMGRIVNTQAVSTNAQVIEVQLDHSGIYLLRITDAIGRSTTHLVVN